MASFLCRCDNNFQFQSCYFRISGKSNSFQRYQTTDRLDLQFRPRDYSFQRKATCTSVRGGFLILTSSYLFKYSLGSVSIVMNNSYELFKRLKYGFFFGLSCPVFWNCGNRFCSTFLSSCNRIRNQRTSSIIGRMYRQK